MIEIQELTDTSVFGQIAEHQHEQVVFCHDHETGLRAIIGIHNTVLGPALGGTRMWQYASDAEALNDVLRLSRGMSYKAAISGLNLGGGKAVIIGDAKTQKNEALLRKFGRFVQNLNGKYITAEDVGMTTKDMEYIHMETKHVAGLPESMGGSGDPSPVTAYGTYMGMKAAAKKAFGSDSLAGKRIAVQGVGHVGGYLLEHLAKEGAKIILTDYYEDRKLEMAAKYKAIAVDIDEIYDQDMDIYSPCALGATINDDTLSRLKCRVIAGSANNQLKNEDIHGPALVDRGIVYAPDFLINAGGLINVYSEVVGTSRQAALNQTEKIYDFTLQVLNKAEQEGSHPQKAAIRQAEERIAAIGKVKSTY
ncbi:MULTISPECIES: Glu/Leu/Phe/Val dehydrogenase dimerization domain-containing protein [Hymenobacter]|uniref:Glu/Leu/Phe/Val dehydrogenase n=1 Tax=Hymenobacter jejuensis TaxID=2502781 RepID=A0A5B7ZYQ2_9BACT|nr:MULTISPECIES: Glu/Leu/Phe/Val dehydrogenase dimerization domain-containing protein [Hymenobacter]MBC6991690.1 Glu/Leu/Phe/Val dehydrogenase [Hymenobacter sp. BT491]QDA60017.1 Glu/Leu/Phe/Val dehydrogenase [Hymenobacter jejuensis]